MGTPFHSHRDVRMNLNNTVCYHKGKPVHVAVPEEEDPIREHCVRTCEITTRWRDFEEVDYRDDTFVYNDVKLGYMNRGGCAQYLRRAPRRQYSQGLSLSQIAGYDHNRDFWHSVEFKRLLTNRYPRMEVAIEKVMSTEWSSFAFSRHFCIGSVDKYTLGLYHRERLIAMKNKNYYSWQMIPARDTSLLRKVMQVEGIEL